MGAIRCVNCGSQMIDKNFNHAHGHTAYKCNECGTTFYQMDITYCEECGEQIIDGMEDFVFLDKTLCKDCYNKKIDEWII